MRDFDVIVIGSGAGGLCSAALLAAEEFRTLLLERLPFLGGRFSSLTRKGYTFTTGAVSIEGRGPLEKVFRKVGAPFDIRYPDPQVVYRIKGNDFLLPEKGGMNSLLDQASYNPNEVLKVSKAIKTVSAKGVEEVSVSAWLARYTRDPGVFGVFRALCGAIFSLAPEEAPMEEFVRMMKKRSFRQFGFPSGGNAELVEALERSIQGKGGLVFRKSAARRIMVEEGRATGVEWIGPDGKTEEASCSFVISDVGARNTVKLTGRNWFSQSEILKVSKARPSYTLVLEILSDRPLLDCPGVLMVPEATRAAFATCPTLLCPDLAPKGKHITIVLGAPRRSEEPLDVEEEFKLLLRDARANLPKFDRYARNWVLRSFRKDWPGYRSRPGDDLPFGTLFPNLFNVGDSVKPPGSYGVGACAESAWHVTNSIREMGIQQ